MFTLNTSKSKQCTLKEAFALSGIGVHSGLAATVTLYPAPVDHGIEFAVKIENGFDVIPARFSTVSTVKNATALGGKKGATLCTVEHVLAALAGLGVDNCRIEVEGGEVPVLDGSSEPFVDEILRVGIVEQSRDKNILKVLRPVSAEIGEARATLVPYNNGFHIDVEIDFKEDVIGRMRYAQDVTSTQFVRDIAGARTFGFLHQHEAMLKSGLALGASTDNTVIFDGDRVINENGLRYDDECVRHKWLDALGDLSLAGGQIAGKYSSYRGGHALNVKILQALFADPNNYEWMNPPLSASNQNEPNLTLAAGN